MKKILALFLLTAAGLFGQGQELNLGSHGKITLYLLDDGWKFNVSEFADRLMVTVVPKSGDVNANCTLTVAYPEKDTLTNKSRLRDKVEADSAAIAEHSAEGKAVAKEFSLRSGFGFHCDFTDPDLIGKPPEKDNFKTISTGLIHLAPDVLVEVGISADGFKSAPYQTLLGMIEGMDFTAGTGAAR
ncbi:MAG TPA: hypothetical protein VG838_04005 [Opitutaceae bacterium]|nr:hypothetical protein [Opitutaceae bacterium]